MNAWFSRRVVLLALALSATLAACSPSESEGPKAATPSQARAPNRVLVVASAASYPPFEFLGATGKVEGFDVDLLEAVADKAGLKLRFINVPWADIFKSLDSGESDLIASSVTITAERKKTMEFSDPYFDAIQLVMTKPDSAVVTMQDVKGQVVGVQKGSTSDSVASNIMGQDSPSIKRFDTTQEAIKALETGELGAVISDNGVVSHYILHNTGSEFKLVDDPTFAPERYGFVAKKSNADLIQRLNEGLKSIRNDGTYERIYAKWFGAGTAPAAR